MILAYHVTKVAENAMIIQTNVMIAKKDTSLNKIIALNVLKIALIVIQQNVLNVNLISIQMENLVQHVQQFASNVMDQQQMIA